MEFIAVIDSRPASAAEAVAMQADPEPGAKSPPAYPFHGRLATRYRYRGNGRDSDQDAYQYLGLDAGDPLKNKVTAHAFARTSVDLDGRHDTDGFYVFDSIADTHDSNVNGRLYYLYLDVHRVEDLELIRLGRQIIHNAPVPIYIDGAMVRAREYESPYKIELGAYGGVPVNYLYESDPDQDLAYGAYVNSKVWPGARIQVGYNHGEDEYLDSGQKDDLYSLELWQAFNQRLSSYFSYTMLDQKNRDLFVRAAWLDPENDLAIQASFYQLLTPQKINTLALDPYFSSLQEYMPYWQAGLLVSKGMGDNFFLEGGVSGRKLISEKDEGEYNHEFLHCYVTLRAVEGPDQGFEFSLTPAIWESYTNDQSISSIDAELGYRTAEKTSVFAGTSYTLYKYDFYLDTERDQVRTYYVKGRIFPTDNPDNLSFVLTYQYEVDDFDEYHQAEAGLRYAF